MIKEQFISLLRNPATINLNMIKGLEEITDRFPYFQNAHLLLAKQYHGHENIRYESYLRKASAYAADRKLLYELIKNEPAHVIHMSVANDTLTLDESPEFSDEKISFSNSTIPEINSLQEHLSIVTEDISTPEIVIQEDTNEKIQEKEITGQDKLVLSEETTTTSVDPKSIIEQRLKELAQEKNISAEISVSNTIEKTIPAEEKTISEIAEIKNVPEGTPVINIENKFKELQTEKTTKSETTPVPEKNTRLNTESHSFVEWLRLKSVPIIPDNKVSEYLADQQTESLLKPIEKEIKKADNQLIEKFIKTEPRIVPSRSEFYSPGNMARLSAREHEDLISETLARIYAQQGNDRKAIETYHKLALKIPEKSGYFAALIKELEEKDKKPNL